MAGGESLRPAPCRGCNGETHGLPGVSDRRQLEIQMDKFIRFGRRGIGYDASRDAAYSHEESRMTAADSSSFFESQPERYESMS